MKNYSTLLQNNTTGRMYPSTTQAMSKEAALSANYGEGVRILGATCTDRVIDADNCPHLN
jgi:hypothetical protein